jgi:hypothetical protein
MKKWQLNVLRGLTGAGMLALFSGCGIQYYPGQDQLVTDNYSKIDLEFLDSNGLWAYEVNYDNRNSSGRANRIGAIVTKLYPGAQTFTSNARTNADGTLYWAKNQYNGALMEAISTPKLNQIIMPANSLVQIFLSYSAPMDEVDDRNIAEEHMYDTKLDALIAPVRRIGETLRLKWELLRAGNLLPSGGLSYNVTSIDLGDKSFTPPSPVTFESNFAQNGVRTNLDDHAKAQFVAFVEKNVPTGFQGTVAFHLQGVAAPITTTLSIQTVNTAIASGIQVVRNATQEQMQQAAEQSRVSR